MNYEKHLIAFCIPGETGNSIIVTSQEKSQVKALKLFPGGNGNVSISKKKFKHLLSSGKLEVIEKLPKEVYKDFLLTWKNNSKVDTEEKLC